MIIASIAYILTRVYMNAKADETVVHEWIDFPELETFQEAKTPKEDKQTTLHVEIRYHYLNNLNISFLFRHVVKLFLVDMMLIVMIIMFVIQLLFVLIIIILLFNYQQRRKKKNKKIKKFDLLDIDNIFSKVNNSEFNQCLMLHLKTHSMSFG
jgi:hypothetical protein